MRTRLEELADGRIGLDERASPDQVANDCRDADRRNQQHQPPQDMGAEISDGGIEDGANSLRQRTARLRQPRNAALVERCQPGLEDGRGEAGAEDGKREQDDEAEDGADQARADVPDRGEHRAGDGRGHDMDGRPQHRRDEARGEEDDRTHAEDAGGNRNHGLDAGQEAADDHAHGAMAGEEGAGAVEKVGPFAERPDVAEMLAIAAPEKIGDAVRDRRSRDRPGKERPDGAAGRADEAGEDDDDARSRHDRANHDDGLERRREEDDDPDQRGMVRHKGRDGLSEVHGRSSVAWAGADGEGDGTFSSWP